MSRLSVGAGTFPVLAALAVAVVGQSSLVAEVVIGNLGSTGAGGLSATGTAIAFSERLAQGFGTGSSTTRTLQSVSLGLFWNDSFSATVNILLYSDVSNAPGSVIATSAPVNVQAKSVYTFPFSSVPLSENANYWIVPPDGLTWYLNAGESSPVAENGSGYSFLGTTRSLNSGATWSSFSPTSYSVSVAAVPEPGMPGPLLVALAACGTFMPFPRSTSACRSRPTIYSVLRRFFI
jgi:hypothetical protein